MPKNPHPFRILFVCMGNICRSPAAEIIFQTLVTDARREHEFVIDSAGTIGFHAGHPPDARMAATLERIGYRVTGSARQILPEDLDRFDLIVTMDEDNTMDVLALATTPEQRAKVLPLVGFCREHDAPNVPDPYHGGQRGFDHVIELLQDGCAGILTRYAA